MENMMIHIIFVVLASLFTGITFFRMYRRTGLKGHLFVSLGALIVIIGIVGVFISDRTGNERMVDILGQVLVIPGIILAVIGLILIYTIESGTARNAYSGHSIFDIVFGNVSSLKKKKYIPTLGHGGGLAGGSIVIIYGIAKCWDGYPSKSYVGIFLITVGLSVFVISIVALKGKNKNIEERGKGD